MMKLLSCERTTALVHAAVLARAGARACARTCALARAFSPAFPCALAAIFVGILVARGAFAQAWPASILIGQAQMLSSAGGAPQFEMTLPSSLPKGITIALASPQIHLAKGYPYPLWLSDATFEVRDRPYQRYALHVLTHRAPTDNQSEIMLEVSHGASKRFVPYHLWLDATHPSLKDLSIASPLPPVPTGYPRYPDPAHVIAHGVEMPPISVATSLVEMDKAQASSAGTAASQPPTPRAQAHNAKRRPTTTSAAAPTVQTASLIVPAQAASAPTPAITASSAASPPQPAPQPRPQISPLPAQQQQAVPAAPNPHPPPTPYRFLNDPLIWSIATAIALLLLLALIYRLWSQRRSKQALNAPLLTQETQFGPAAGRTANTVFGLSDQEAIDMQQKWKYFPGLAP